MVMYLQQKGKRKSVMFGKSKKKTAMILARYVSPLLLLETAKTNLTFL